MRAARSAAGRRLLTRVLALASAETVSRSVTSAARRARSSMGATRGQPLPLVPLPPRTHLPDVNGDVRDR